MASERVSTGMAGLDEALSGGVPLGNLVLVSGGAGTGKSTLCMQFLVNGAIQGEKGLYISTEQRDFELFKQASNYNWDLKEFVTKGLIRVEYINILSEENSTEVIRRAVADFSPNRIVLDSLSTFSEYAAVTDFARQTLLQRGGVSSRTVDEVAPKRISEKTLIKRMLASLLSEFRSFGATVLFTSELPERGDYLSSDGISEFLADGVLTIELIGGFGSGGLRNIRIRKMRYSKHTTESLPFEITTSGISVEYDKTRK